MGTQRQQVTMIRNFVDRRVNKLNYLYLAKWPSSRSEGVRNKVRHSILGLNRAGYLARSIIVQNSFFLKCEIEFFKVLSTARVDTLIVRARPFLMIIYLIPLLVQRALGTKIIIDIPTPISIVRNEIASSGETFILKLIKIILIYISNPIGYLPAHRLLQYSVESKYFLTGLKHKTVLTSNGIYVNSISPKTSLPKIENEMILIGVAELSFWHGYDRMIRSIDKYNESSPDRKFKLILVGDGAEREALERLTIELNLKEYVQFEGFKSGDELTQLFSKAHIGVCSLALFRKNLSVASELKAREYTARAIPFILSASDPDFIGCDFVFKVTNDSVLIDLVDVFKWYQSLNMIDNIALKMRQFAESNLDYGVKVIKDFQMA